MGFGSKLAHDVSDYGQKALSIARKGVKAVEMVSKISKGASVALGTVATGAALAGGLAPPLAFVAEPIAAGLATLSGGAALLSAGTGKLASLGKRIQR
jgi:X-X-X-Leu-X-X-Gly heptad repeat protein